MRILSFLLSICCTVPAFAQSNFYVSSSGNDANSGSMANPWRTIQFAVDAINPGQTINVLPGVYTDRVIFSGIDDSGSVGSYVTLRAEGNVVIDGSSLSPTGRDGLISIVNASYINISGFEIRDFQTPNPIAFDPNEPIGLLIEGSSSNIRIFNNVIHGIKNHSSCADGDVVSGQPCYSGANGIAVYGNTTQGISDLNFTGNEVYDCVTASSEVFTLNGNISRFHLVNNYVHDNNNIGIDFIGFENDVCPSCGNDNQARNGIVIGNRAENNSILGGPNHSPNPWYQESVNANEGNAGGFYVDGGRYILFDGNSSSGNDLGFEFGSENQFRATEDILMINNIVFDNKENGVIMGGYSSQEDDPNGGGGDANRIFVYNNSFYKNKGWGSEIVFQNRVKDSRIANNIFWGESSVLENFEEYGSSSNINNTWGTNLWWGSSTSGQSSLPGIRIVQDPIMTSPSTGNLEIASGSPAKDVGVEEANLNWPDAFWAANFPSGLIPAHGDLDFGMYPRINNILDLGADEYNVSEARVQVAPKLFLQGPFDNLYLDNSLNANALLPLNHPYSGAPWNETTSSVSSIPSIDIVDWVLLRLYQGDPASPPMTLLASQTAFIKADGIVMDRNGNPSVSFVANSGNYYLVIDHRNHLAVMTSTTLALSDTPTTYDFTTSQSKAYGSNPMAPLTGGVFGLWGGDGDHNGSTSAFDFTTVWLPQNGGPAGYHDGDFNLSGSVSAFDFTLTWLIANGRTSQVP